jgi:hypothetical protein
VAQDDSYVKTQLSLLRPQYPGWFLWHVHCVVSPDVWCARPLWSPVSTIRVHSPEALIKAIAEADDMQLTEMTANHPGRCGGQFCADGSCVVCAVIP